MEVLEYRFVTTFCESRTYEKMNRYKIKLKEDKFLNFELPKSIRVSQMKSKLPTISGEKEDMKKEIYKALDNSEGLSLKEAVDLSRPVVITIDDHTRETPVLPAIEILYEKLQQIGVKNEQIYILTSNGTHRKLKKKELYSRIGNLLDTLTVVQHNCYEEENHFLSGYIDGIPIILNKLLQRAGSIIGIGSIMAHKFSGWSGGGKIICPGVTGYKTIFLSHRKAIVEEQIIPGMRNNWFRSFIDKVSKSAGLKYVINFVPGIDGVFSVFAGEPDAVLNKGIKIAENNFINWFDNRFDIAIISAFPAITDFWQSGKGFYLGDMIVKDGGTIILVTPLDEGLGDHPNFMSILDMDSYQIKHSLNQNLIADPLAAVAAYAIRNIANRCTLRIISTNPVIQNIRILDQEITSNIQNILNESLNQDTSDIALLNDIYILPKCKSKEGLK